jgi:hypothetical protein
MAVVYNPKIVTDGLVLALDAGNTKSYPGSGTTWKDLTGNGYDVILQNGPVFNTNHFTFDGTNVRGYVKTLNYGSGNIISEMSVFGWIRTTFNSGTPGVWNGGNWAFLDFDRRELFTFAINTTGEVQMSGKSFNSGGFDALYDLVGTKRNNDGNFHYIGYTFSVANQEIVMYVDGEVDRTHTANGNMTALGNGTTRFGIVGDGSEAGSEGGTGNNIYYDGDIAIIHFYDGKVLTASEVAQNFNATKGRYGI